MKKTSTSCMSGFVLCKKKNKTSFCTLLFFSRPWRHTTSWALKHQFLADSLLWSRKSNFHNHRVEFCPDCQNFPLHIFSFEFKHYINTHSFRQDKRVGWLQKVGQLDWCCAMARAKRRQPLREHSRFRQHIPNDLGF